MPGLGKLVKADPIADTFRADIKSAIAASKAPPKLVGILATDAKPSAMYAQFTKKTCAELGVEFVLKTVGAAASGDGDSATIEQAIVDANEDDSIGGIMVYYPIFGGLQDHYLQQLVAPAKDVEGLNVKFHYNLYHNIRFISPASLLAPTGTSIDLSTISEDNIPPGIVKSIIPCTPLAIVKSLEYIGVYNNLIDYGDRAYGRTITVINRSEVVGRPLAALLANDGARVFSVDIDSIQEYNKRPSSFTYQAHHTVHPTSLTLAECLALSDVVITGVPNAAYKVDTALLKPGTVCVNVASEKNFGADVREKASIYVPAVGKVTILMLLRNLLRLQEYQTILKQQADTPLQ